MTALPLRWHHMGTMTNTLAFSLASLLGLAVVADVTLNDSAALLFLGKKFFDLLHWIAFWR